jgi:hypothetical protein
MMDMDEIASVVRALEPEFADDRGRLKRLEGYCEQLADGVNMLDQRLAMVEAYLSGVGDVELEEREPEPELPFGPASYDELLLSMAAGGVTVAQYAKFLRELKDRDADGEVDG